MSLIAKVQINEDHIGTVVARRMSGTEDPESWGTYEYRIIDQRASGHTDRLAAGDVRHRYGDGAFILLARVLEAAHGQLAVKS